MDELDDLIPVGVVPGSGGGPRDAPLAEGTLQLIREQVGDFVHSLNLGGSRAAPGLASRVAERLLAAETGRARAHQRLHKWWVAGWLAGCEGLRWAGWLEGKECIDGRGCSFINYYYVILFLACDLRGATCLPGQSTKCFCTEHDRPHQV
jgi:hypothetical protein